jgi:AraC-like DNA-binding protein
MTSRRRRGDDRSNRGAETRRCVQDVSVNRMFVRFERRFHVPELDAERRFVMLRRPGLRLYTIATRGLTVDSQAAPALSPLRPNAARPAGQLTVPLEGEFTVRRAGRYVSVHGRAAVCDAVDEYDERWEGSSFRALVFEWDVRHGDTLRTAETVAIGPGDLDALRVVADALDAGELPDHTVQGAFERLASMGVPVRGLIDEDRAAPADAHRLAEVLGALLGRLAKAPSIDDLACASGVEERQLRRRLRACAPWILPDAGTWKSVLRRTRLTMAACLPSSPRFTNERMAAALGYRHAAALLHAMRNAGLPTPTEIRARIATAR